jgi:hypothetical protein
MNITTEELKTLYEGARDYALFYYDKEKEPSALKLKKNGTITADYFNGNTIDITAENLTEDLAEAKRILEERAKNKRRKQYEELKKEFESEG